MNRAQRDGETTLLAILGLGVALLALIWLWGGLAGLIFGAGWPRLDAAALLHVAVSLPQHLHAPAGSWPPVARALLPGTASLYAVLGLLLALMSVLIAGAGRYLPRLVARLGRGGTGGRGGGGDAGAHWASPHELRSLRAHRRLLRGGGGDSRADDRDGRDGGGRGSGDGGGGRIALGVHRGRLLYAERRHALVVFGPPQSGKSAGLAIPALLEWQGPAVASSIKGDLLQATLRRRRELGEVMIFDPFGLSGLPGNTWSPLREAGTWDGALEVAWRLAAAGELDQHAVEGGEFWAVAAEQRLAPLLYVAATSGLGMEQVVAWAYGEGRRELQNALAVLTEHARDERSFRDARQAHAAVDAFAQQADRTRSSIEATVQALLRAYRFTRVLRSAGGCEITAERLLSGSATLYLIGDAKASKLLRPLLVALLSEVVDHAYATATAHGGSLTRPLLLCLDEAGNVAPLPNLAEIASTAPSHGIQLISIFHDLTQARSRYGNQAETVVNSHRARMLLPGVADLATLRYFADLIGETEQRELTRTHGEGGSSRSLSTRRAPLAASDTLRRIDADTAVLLYGRLPPVRLRLRLWFRDRRLRRLAAGNA